MNVMEPGAGDGTVSVHTGALADTHPILRTNQPVGRRWGEGASSVMEHLQADARRIPGVQTLTGPKASSTAPQERPGAWAPGRDD